ncbi:DotU family type IV/VI secretion system protein [Massilia sp. W12]|uniref:DotU family type IV/VI secretion system protein n=1 Tax=Massilia sp. W12 TaxID=3126507 RepID=UPI0030CF2DD8
MRDAPDSDQVEPGGAIEFALLDLCAQFYEEIAAMKDAQSEGRLASWLSADGGPPPQSPQEFARQLSNRLAAQLRSQERSFAARATLEQARAHRIALYAMAALADEILLLELEWPGQEAWLQVLLEQRLFGSNDAGSRFYAMARQLLKIKGRSPLYADLAGVFLLALELGFRGCYRGRQGQPELSTIRQMLYRMVRHSSPGKPDVAPESIPAFQQAYDFLLTDGQDERLAPLSPWRNLGLYALLAYLLLTIVAWLILMHPFEEYLAQ